MFEFEGLITQISESPEILIAIQKKRLRLFKQVHEIVFYGKGGYDFDTVYHMPVWLRKYIFHELNEHYEREAAALKKSSSGTTQSQQQVYSPGVKQADYSVQRRSRKS